MQYLDRLMNALDVRENYASSSGSSEETPESTEEDSQLSANNVHTYLSKIMYKRRTDFNPLWNHILVAGISSEQKPFLASVDLLGTTFSSPSLATGYGAHLAQPIMRKLVPDEASVEHVTKEQAIAVVKECMKVLFYRDARSLDGYSIAVISKKGGVEAEGAEVAKGGVDLKESEKLEGQSWAFAERIRGYGTQVN